MWARPYWFSCFYKRCLQILDLTEITKNELKESFQDVLRIGITSSNGGLIQFVYFLFLTK